VGLTGICKIVPNTTMGRPKKEPTEVVFARLPERLVRKLRRLAAQQRRELSMTIRLIVEGYFGKTCDYDTLVENVSLLEAKVESLQEELKEEGYRDDRDT
jgi:hypothetical protein